MTYGELRDWLDTLTEDQLNNMDVTVYQFEEDEYHPVEDVDITQYADVLDDEHPIIIIN